MCTNVLQILVLFFSILLTSEAFWWQSSSSDSPTPPPPIFKQIPLTYFRTYTYQQPLTSAAMQLPLLSSTDYITNYKPLSHTPYFNPMLPLVPLSLPTNNEIATESSPRKGYGNYNLIRSLGALLEDTTFTPEPTTSTTVTTTTTTTTPEPTTTTSTEAPTILQLDGSNDAIPHDTLDNMAANYQAFNRKAFTNHFNINYQRPIYPYPEYSFNKLNSHNDISSPTGNIEFVPCMCPVNIQNAGFPSGYQTGLPVTGTSSKSTLFAQSRTNAEEEGFLDLPTSNNPLNSDAKSIVTDSSDIEDDLQTNTLVEETDEQHSLPKNTFS